MSIRMLFGKRTAAVVLATTLLFLSLVGVGLVESALLVQEISPPYPEPSEALNVASAWLVSNHRNDDGGFTSFSMGANSGPSDVGGTVDALLALAAAGSDVAPSLVYLRDNVDSAVAYAAQDGSTAGKLVLALSLAGEDAHSIEDNDFVVSLTGHLSPTGQYGVSTAFNQSLAILGLAAAGESVPEQAVEWLIGLQETEGELAGSWGDGFGTDGNADSTAMAMMALMVVDDTELDDALSEAATFLDQTKLQSGGWEYGLGFGENANSTALALQALYVLGEDVLSQESDWAKDGVTPLAALLSWQSETGAFQADFGDGRFDDFFSSVQSIPALAAVALAEEQVFVPAVSAGTSPEEDESAPEPVVVEPTDAPVLDAETESDQTEAAEPVEEDGGGFSICGSTMALSLLAGMIILAPLRRRR